MGHRLTALVKRGLYGLFGDVDGSATRLFLVHAERGHALHQLGHAPGFAQKQGFGVLQIRRRVGLGKRSAGRADDVIQVGHTKIGISGLKKNGWHKKGLVLLQALALVSGAPYASIQGAAGGNQAASLAFTCSTMPAKAAMSCTAISLKTLRSISICAFLSPLANWL